MEYLEPDYLVADFFITHLEFLRDRASLYRIGTRSLTDIVELYCGNKHFCRETNLLVADYTSMYFIDEKPFSYLLERFTKDKKFYVKVHNILELQGKRLLREHKQRTSKPN